MKLPHPALTDADLFVAALTIKGKENSFVSGGQRAVTILFTWNQWKRDSARVSEHASCWGPNDSSFFGMSPRCPGMKPPPRISFGVEPATIRTMSPPG